MSANPTLNAALTGRYSIERELGAGGMATVYLAHDVRHDRRVALKVLRPELSAILGAERFLAEIKTTANLQHPHILSLFDSGEADGTVFYVMPYVEGETLRERIKREQQLPIDDAVRIAREVLDALEYAHQHGIVHRDIKPENILLHGGHAMVADFGIALAASKVDGGTRMTETGMSLGTPHYMSPEQAMGDRVITPRADIYAAGCVLYEMLTGEPPFTGQSAQAVFARVLTEEARSLTLQRKTIPPHVESAVSTALQKLPADRFASAAEFASALGGSGFNRAASVAAVSATRGTPARGGRDWRTITIASAAGLALGAAGAVGVARANRVEVVPREVRFTLSLTDSSQYSDTFGRSIAISPDGSTIVYSGGSPGRRQLFVRRLDDNRALPLAGTEGAYMPFFSPNGEWLGFVANQRLMKVRLAGGTPIGIAQLLGNTVSGATWGPRDEIVLEDVTGLSRVDAGGGKLADLIAVDSVNTVLTWPWFFPDGDAVLCTVNRAAGSFIGVVTLADGKLTVFEDVQGTDARYVEPGYVMWTSSDGVLLGAAFDTKARRFTGKPIPVQEGIVVAGGGAKIAIGPDVFIRIEGGAQRARLLSLDRQGKAKPLTSEELNYTHVRLSPDEQRIVYVASSSGAPNGDVWILNRARGTRQRVTVSGVSDFTFPEWSRDGRRLALGVIPNGSWDVAAVNSDGSGGFTSLVATTATEYPVGWAPGGQFIFWRQTQNRGDIYYVDSIGGAEHEFAATPANETAPTLSPDGKWLAFASDESNTREVYVRPFPKGEGRWQISTDGGIEPRWSKNGREIVYRDGELFLAVPITAGAGISIGTADTLFRGPYATNTARASYDINGAGTEIFIIGTTADDRKIGVTINPFGELLRPRR